MNLSRLSSPAKVGFFAILALAVLSYLVYRVNDFKFSSSGSYPLYLQMPSAEGLDYKTPVLLAGIEVGVVDQIDLVDGNQARVKLKLRGDVRLPKDVEAQVKTKGVLGDVFLELIPGRSPEELEKGGTVTHFKRAVDVNELAANLNDVALNLKDISASMNRYTKNDNSAVAKILGNVEKITANMADIAVSNRKNIDAIVGNLRDLTKALNSTVENNSQEIHSTLTRLNSITSKIDQGRGTVGRLINDSSIAEKVDETLEGVSDLVGKAAGVQTEVGYHLEYLGKTKDFKNYVSMAIRPRPDKALILEMVSDPDPAPIRTQTTTEVTAGGITNTVVSNKEEVQRNKVRISAMLAKKIYDFTFRAGLIESTGGVGVDYQKGPFGVQFSAFDFSKSGTDRPHLKAMATVNLTKSLYVLGGADDFISKRHDPDWFIGVGLRFLDEDIKSLLGAFSLKR